MNDNKKKSEDKEKQEFPGYPLYPASEDVFNRGLIVEDIDPDDITKLKAPNEDPDAPNEKNYFNDITGGDLDIPGDETDELSSGGGIEDEENSFSPM